MATRSPLEIETGYRSRVEVQHDRMAVRNKFGRQVRFIIILAFLLAFPIYTVGYAGWYLFDYEGTGHFVGSILSMLLILWITPTRQLVYNPENSAYLTQNMWTGDVEPYGPGLHSSDPWENRNADGNFSLRVITRSIDLTVSTATTAVTAKIVFSTMISLEYLPKAVVSNAANNEKSLIAFIKSFLSSRWAGQSADYVRSHVGEYNNSLATEFLDERRDSPNHPSNLETNFGFRTVSVVIETIALPPDVQATRDAHGETIEMFGLAAELLGYKTDEDKVAFARRVQSGDVSHEQYMELLNRAMATSKNAALNIEVIEAANLTGLAAGFVSRFGRSGSERPRTSGSSGTPSRTGRRPGGRR